MIHAMPLRQVDLCAVSEAKDVDGRARSEGRATQLPDEAVVRGQLSVVYDNFSGRWRERYRPLSLSELLALCRRCNEVEELSMDLSVEELSDATVRSPFATVSRAGFYCISRCCCFYRCFFFFCFFFCLSFFFFLCCCSLSCCFPCSRCFLFPRLPLLLLLLLL
jgi:hypothetical protein